MKCFTLVTSIIFHFFSCYLYSQNISGKVYNPQQIPITFAEISLIKDSISVVGLTDEQGYYQIDLPEKGIYQLTINYNGITIYTSSQTIFQPTIKNFELALDGEINLNEVVLIGQKKLVERKSDRLVFNFENSIAANGGTGLDALKITPLIEVKDEQIALRGKSSLLIMVNGKIVKLQSEDLINYLKQIRSEDIKSLEVITNPNASFDAEGNSGILNIILKKNLNDSWLIKVGADNKQSIKPQQSQNITLSYQKKALSTYLSLNHYDGLYYFRKDHSKIKYSDKLYNAENLMDYAYGSNLNAYLNVDYDISNKLSIGIEGLWNKNIINGTEKNKTSIITDSIYLISTDAITNRNRNNKNLNFHSNYQLDSLGSTINLNIDFFDYTTHNQRVFTKNEFEGISELNPISNYKAENNSHQQINNYAIQLDVNQFLKLFQIHYGVKASNTKTKSYIEYFDLNGSEPLLDKQKSDSFDFDEKIYAAYLGINKKWGEKWETNVGLRYEKTLTEGNSHQMEQKNRKKYDQLFPSINLSYSINKQHQLSLTYGKRINRPYYTSLNPFVRYINPYTTSEGNPFLEPYITNNLELTHSLKDKLISTIYFSHSKNVSNQVNFISNENINSATKYENFYNQSTLGLSEYLSLKPFPFWEASVSANVYYKQIKSFLPQTLSSFNSWSGFLRIGNNLALDQEKNWLFSLEYWMQLAEYDAIYYKKTYSSLDLGLKAMFFNKKLVLSLYASDIFRTFKIKNTSSFNNIQNQFSNYEDRQAIRLSFVYTFFNNLYQSKSNTSSNTEEKQRAE